MTRRGKAPTAAQNEPTDTDCRAAAGRIRDSMRTKALGNLLIVRTSGDLNDSGARVECHGIHVTHVNEQTRRRREARVIVTAGSDGKLIAGVTHPTDASTDVSGADANGHGLGHYPGIVRVVWPCRKGEAGIVRQQDRSVEICSQG